MKTLVTLTRFALLLSLAVSPGFAHAATSTSWSHAFTPGTFSTTPANNHAATLTSTTGVDMSYNPSGGGTVYNTITFTTTATSQCAIVTVHGGVYSATAGKKLYFNWYRPSTSSYYGDLHPLFINQASTHTYFTFSETLCDDGTNHGLQTFRLRWLLDSGSSGVTVISDFNDDWTVDAVLPW